MRYKHVIGVTLQWRELTYVVQTGRGRKRKPKTVLQGISGHVTPGHLLAVMGPTGALPGCLAAGCLDLAGGLSAPPSTA